MDRREAVLRELNLYPQWVRRGRPDMVEPPVAEEPEVICAEPTQKPVSAESVIQPAPAHTALELPRVRERPDDRSSKTGSYADSPVVTPVSEVDKLNWPELKQQVRDCTACKLRAGCTQTVFGVGDEQADWLFVGEGPGADEDARGEPFVGEAGKLLDNMLLAIKLKRGRNVYITNIVKCRPPNNRAPEADEVAVCMPYLHRQISLIQPKLIVALGKVASNALLGRNATLGSLRGTLHDYHGIPTVVTYHPAYLLRSPSEKAKAWQDLCLAVKTISQ